jgi:hypothetical protein
MDVIQLYQDFSVDFVTEGHKHARPGWVNTECPWCTGNPGYHLGYELSGNYYYCWRCGWHPIISTVAKLIYLPESETRELIRRYGILVGFLPKEKKKTNNKELKLPSGITALTDNHDQYLTGRGFDPERLKQIWGLQSTGPVSKLNGLDYKNRILIPFYWNGQMVSFDTRSISLNAPHEMRYRACPSEHEVLSHKEILYGRQDEWRETGICVEGPTDVWRFSTCSFATSGIQFTPEQVRLMAKIFKRVQIVYDPEPQAQIQAKKLRAELLFRGVEANVINLMNEEDPGRMKQSDADYLVKQLIK